MKRQNNIVYLVAALCFSVATTAFAGQQGIPHEPPAKKVFVFDFHGVLADTHYPTAIAKGIMHLPIIIPTILYRMFWEYPIWKRHASGCYPWKAIIDAFAPASSCQRLRPHTKAAVEGLHQAGYPLYLFSNVTPAPYEYLCKRYPLFFSLFTKALIVNPNTQPPWVSKTDPRAYAICEEAIQAKHPDAQIIFFDDTKERCEQGKTIGWQTVHVTSDGQCAQVIAAFRTPVVSIS